MSQHTLLQQLKHPWENIPDSGQEFYFCATPGCRVVYFAAAGKTLGEEALRQPVGQKRCAAEDPLCYCFDIRYGDTSGDGGKCRQFVIDKTRAGLCACNSRNPSGRCCLRDFPDSN